MEDQGDKVTYFLPILNEDEWANLKQYFYFYEIHREDLSKWAEAVLMEDSQWGRILLDMSDKEKERSREQSYQTQKNAILKGEWEPYLEYLRTMGIMYANFGYDFHSWFELVNLIRRYLTPILLKEQELQPTIRILNGMDIFMDIIMSNIGEAYIEEKKRVIEQQKQEQELLNKELEQFVYIASHDLQEPLTTINSFVGILENEYTENFDGEAREFLHFIKESSTRMTQLINGLLEYSRMGKMSRPTMLNLHQTVEEVKQDMIANILKNEAEIQVENMPELYLSPIETKLLFQNLIGNAIKFRKKDVNPTVRISSEKLGSHWHFKVEDNGIGIPPQHQKKIFTIFKRLHNKDEYDGTGLGLAHCKKIVENCGGKIWVESSLGKGSTFHFTLAEKHPDEKD